MTWGLTRVDAAIDATHPRRQSPPAGGLEFLPVCQTGAKFAFLPPEGEIRVFSPLFESRVNPGFLARQLVFCDFGFFGEKEPKNGFFFRVVDVGRGASLTWLTWGCKDG